VVSPRRKRILLGAWLALLVAGIVYQGLARPKYSYDMVFYVGAAMGIDAAPSGLHELTFDELRSHVPPQRFSDLVEKSEYRARIYEDPRAFADNLRFYRIRPLYVGMIRALHELGLDYVFACHLISALAAAATFWLFAWAAPGNSLLPRALLAPLLALALGLVNVGRMAMPDALSALFFFGAALLILRRHTTVALLLLVTSVTVRTDNIIFCGMLVAYLRFLAPVEHRIANRSFATAAAASAVLYLTITLLGENYGWSTVFYHSFIEKLTRIDGPASVSLADYCMALRACIAHALDFQGFLLGTVLIAAVWVFREGLRDRASPVLLHLALLSGAYVALHFLLFPVTWYRFFVCQYLLIALAALHLTDEATARLLPHHRGGGSNQASFKGGVSQLPANKDSH